MSARRPRWFWEELCEKFEAGDETQGAFAEKHGVNASTFKRWLYQLRAEKGGGEGFVEVKSKEVPQTKTRQQFERAVGGFVQIHVGRLVLESTVWPSPNYLVALEMAFIEAGLC